MLGWAGRAPCREQQLMGPAVLTEWWSHKNQPQIPSLGVQESPGAATEPLAHLGGCSGGWEWQEGSSPFPCAQALNHSLRNQLASVEIK